MGAGPSKAAAAAAEKKPAAKAKARPKAAKAAKARPKAAGRAAKARPKAAGRAAKAAAARMQVSGWSVERTLDGQGRTLSQRLSVLQPDGWRPCTCDPTGRCTCGAA